MLKTIIACVTILRLFICQSCNAQIDSVQFYYLGHSSFIIVFNNEFSILTDYGKPNAYIEYGWNSPIYDLGNYQPAIVTYSHLDDDHYDSTRTPLNVRYVLKTPDTLILNNLTVYPILTSEDNTSIKNNNSYLFDYKGMKILHLGDCQSNIINTNSSDNKNYIRNSIPTNCDVVLIPIEGKHKFLLQTEEFINIIHPKVVIPMHYWSDEYKQSFLDIISTKIKKDKSRYRILRVKNSSFTYVKSIDNDSISIVSIYPSKYSKGKENQIK